jgi:cytochrome b6-f complex iron-sulfur subunit
MANEQWQARVRRAQQMAAERLGVDVSVMQPPRQPGAGGASAHTAEAESARVVEATAVQAVSEPVAAVAGAEAATAAAGGGGAQRIAEAKARAAAKAQATNGGVAAVTAAPTTTAAPAARTAAPAARPATAAPAPAESEEVGQPGINRREFLTYAWGAALGLLTLEIGAASYFFMYPRFRAGEFGGKFFLGEARVLPPTTVGPEGNASGKFWLVNTDEGPKAIYMVCTHLGCLYKWEPSNFRFECPCHASKFTREGYYIEGPASRSLDEFFIEVVENGEVVSTTVDAGDFIQPPVVPGPNAEIVVDTGRRLIGKPAAISPARAGA